MIDRETSDNARDPSEEAPALGGEDAHDYDFSPERVRQIERWLDEGDTAHLEPIIDELHAADIADLLEQTDPDHRWKLVAQFGDRMDAEVFSHLQDTVQSQILEKLDDSEVAAIVDALDSDDAIDLLENFDSERFAGVLGQLSGRVRALVEQGLTFPEDSAGRLIQREVVAFPQFWTVGKTIDYLRADPPGLPDEFHSIFVVDPMHRVTGVVLVSTLLRSRRSVKLSEIADADFDPVSPSMDQEDVAFLFHQYGLVEAPVVNEDGRLLGVITIDDVVDVISEEHGEDILALGGVGADDTFRAVLDTTKARFAWLFVNLITAIVASLVIGLFDATLEQAVALAILMPIVASMGGNAGTQTLTVAVRGLATKQLSKANSWRTLGKETAVGALNGVAFSIITGLVAAVWFSPDIGFVIALAMIINLITAGVFGAAIPILLDRLGVDPSLASTVFLTTVTDVVGFLAFLGLATLILF